MAFVPITSTQTDAKSPIDVGLMNTGLRLNLDDHEARILALEGAVGGGGGEAAAVGTVVEGLKDNVARSKRLRYHVQQVILNSGEKRSLQEGFDPVGEDRTIWIDQEDNNINSVIFDTNAYLGEFIRTPKGNKFSFKIKKGITGFGIGYTASTIGSDTVEVFVNGVAANDVSVALEDENGNAVAASFTTNASTVEYQRTNQFFGLDGQENRIEILNNDSGVKDFDIEFIEIYEVPKEGTYMITTDEPITVESGKAQIRGSQISLAGSNLTIDAPEGYGRTDMLVGNQAGALSISKGQSPAMTQATADIELDWATGFTSLQVKNSFYFPSQGFVVMSQPWGQHFMASYNAKTETLIAQHSLDGLLFSSTPNNNWTPLDGFTGGLGASFGDLNVNLFAAGGVEITSSNNRIDFNIQIKGGSLTGHSATVPVGLYSVDIIKLGDAIVNALEAARSIKGDAAEYFAEWDEGTQKWFIGVRGEAVQAIEFDFNSGVNSASSIHTALGFNTVDLSGSFKYEANTTTQHKAQRILQYGNLIQSDSPNLKGIAGREADANQSYAALRSKLGFGTFYKMTNALPMINLYPDPDSCGMVLSFLVTNQGSMITTQVDNGQIVYLAQSDRSQAPTANEPHLQTAIITYPRGSQVVKIRMESNNNFEINDQTNVISFVAGRQLHTRPLLEKLTLTESMIRPYDINPLQLFRTYYAGNPAGGAWYSPSGTDNVDTITFNGSWTIAANSTAFNGAEATTATINDSVDITFTLAGNGGGISLKMKKVGQASIAQSRDIRGFLVAGAAASEVNTLITRVNKRSDQSQADTDLFEFTGLTAGQYTARFKTFEANNITVVGIGIMDTVEPEINAYTVADLTDDFKTVSSPKHYRSLVVNSDGLDRVPLRLKRQGYKEGRSVVNYGLSVITEQEDDVNTNLMQTRELRFGFTISSTSINDEFKSFQFMKSIGVEMPAFNLNSVTVQPQVDGRNTPNTLSMRQMTKNGGVPSVTAAHKGELIFKNFQLPMSADMPDNNTINVNDTRGMRVGSKVILKADGQPDLVRIITSIITDTSFDVTETVSTFANYTLANNASVVFAGRHSVKVNNDSAATFSVSGFMYEPLDVQDSGFLKRMNPETKTEVVSTGPFVVANGGDLAYPVHSDGVSGNWQTTSIDVLGASSAATYSFPTNLRDINVSSGTLEVKLTSTREVPVED